jgi:hypothetical protein
MDKRTNGWTDVARWKSEKEEESIFPQIILFGKKIV